MPSQDNSKIKHANYYAKAGLNFKEKSLLSFLFSESIDKKNKMSIVIKKKKSVFFDFIFFWVYLEYDLYC